MNSAIALVLSSASVLSYSQAGHDGTSGETSSYAQYEQASGVALNVAPVPDFADATGQPSPREPVRKAVLVAAGPGSRALADAVSGAMAGFNQATNNYLRHEQWDKLAKLLMDCHGDAACVSSVTQSYAQLSKAQDDALATCDLRGDCERLAQDAVAGTQRQMELVAAGQLPENFAGAANLQSLGERLASNPSLRAQVASAVLAKWDCDTNRQRCDIQAATAAGSLLLAVSGGPVVAEVLLNLPAIATSAKMAVEACLANPVQCANQAGLVVADVVAGDALGGASIAGGTLAAGKLAGEAAERGAQAMADAARQADSALVRTVLGRPLTDAEVKKYLVEGFRLDEFDEVMRNTKARVLSRTEVAPGLYVVQYDRSGPSGSAPAIGTRIVYDPAVYKRNSIVQLTGEIVARQGRASQPTGTDAVIAEILVDEAAQIRGAAARQASQPGALGEDAAKLGASSAPVTP